MLATSVMYPKRISLIIIEALLVINKTQYMPEVRLNTHTL